ncbi:MAG: ATP-binding cassette domain-containing protein [Spirosomataceae bacterium]
MLELTNVSLTKGKKQILSEINLSVGTGEVICIIGKNGVGKTTFLKSVLGMTQLTAGKSLFKGVDMRSPERKNVVAEIGAMLYNDTYYDFLTGKENLETVRNFYVNPYFSTNELLELFELKSVENQLVKTYSMGYKQRLLLAMSVVNCPALVVWDEPFNSVDPTYSKWITHIIQHFQKTWNTSFLLTTHQTDGLEDIITRIIVLKKKSIQLDLILEKNAVYWFLEVKKNGKFSEIPVFQASVHCIFDELDSCYKLISTENVEDFCIQNKLDKQMVVSHKPLKINEMYAFI